MSAISEQVLVPLGLNCTDTLRNRPAPIFLLPRLDLRTRRVPVRRDNYPFALIRDDPLGLAAGAEEVSQLRSVKRTMELNPTPSPHTIPPTLNMALSHPHMGPPGPGSSNGHPGQIQYTQQYHPPQGQPQGMLPQGMHMVQLQPGQGQTAFGGVMGAQGPQGGTKVYASVYSGVSPAPSSACELRRRSWIIV